MSSPPIYLGSWQDWSQSSWVAGRVITLDIRSSFLLVSALTIWLILMGGAVWSLTAFYIHRWLAADKEQDAFRLQQRILFANPKDSLRTVIDLLRIFWAWRPSKGPGRIRGRKLRTLILILPAAGTFVSFTVGGVMISYIAGFSNYVRLQPSNCGTFVYERTTTSGNRALHQRILDDTIIGRAYADSCYGDNHDPVKCSLYPVSAIPYHTSSVVCPFGHDRFGNSLCIGDQSLAYQVDTGLMDSNDILGINTRPENRILLRKTVTCSPINIAAFMISDGPIQSLHVGPMFGMSDYTYRYNARAESDGIGYQLFSVEAAPGVWRPIEPLNIQYGDVALVVLTANSIRYLAPVEDPWFAATTPVNRGGNFPTLYTADNIVTAIGCVDQLQICNADTRICTQLSGWLDNYNNFQTIGLNNDQWATAWRLVQAFGAAATFYSINGLGDHALLAQRSVFELVSDGLPSYQWQIEVSGWFETSLAKLQAYVVGYVDHGQGSNQTGNFYSPDSNGSPREQAAEWFCWNQRVRNTGGFQTFSLLGILLLACCGTILCIGNFLAIPVLKRIRRRKARGISRDYREMARIADGNLQLLMTALRESAPEHQWERTLEEIPVTSANSKFPPLRCDIIDRAEYVRYRRSSPETSPMRRSSDVSRAASFKNFSDNEEANYTPKPVSPLSHRTSRSNSSPRPRYPPVP